MSESVMNLNTQYAYSGKSPNPMIEIEMEDGGHICVELYPAFAPKTVKNFLHLIQNNFYDGLCFHRVIAGFMIQCGCPRGDGSGGPGWKIPGEFAQNSFANPLHHTRGILSMARSQGFDSAGSQFFILTDDSPHLDGVHAAFGKVIDSDSMATVERIAMSKTPRSAVESGTRMEDLVDQYGRPFLITPKNVDQPFSPPHVRQIRIYSSELYGCDAYIN